MSRALFVGAGDLGLRAASVLVAAGWPVTALRRRIEALPASITGLRVDLADRHSIAEAMYPAVDVIVVCTTADERTEDAYRTVYVDGPVGVLAAYTARHGAPARVVFVSTTAVYDAASGGPGGVVDETSLTEPARFNGRVMLEAERAMFACGAPSVVVARLGGIYGPGRTRLVERVRAGLEPVGPGVADPHTNRIHVADAAAAVAFLAAHPAPPSIVNVVDDEPARRSDVVRFLAAELGVEVPLAAEGGVSDEPRDDKRVSNATLRAFGFTLRHPTYRDGFAALLRDEASGTGRA